MSLLIPTSPPAVLLRILLHLRTQAKAILPGRRLTKRKLLPIHLRISLPTKVKVQIIPTSLRTSPLINSPLNLTAVLLTDHRDLRLRPNRIVNPLHHTGPTASLLPLTDPHLHPDLPLTVNHHLLTNHPGAVLLLIRVRREVLLPGLVPRGVLHPGLVHPVRAPIRKNSKRLN